MKKIFQIHNKKIIEKVLLSASYGVLSLYDKKPYAVPINYIYFDEAIYFHSPPKGKKMRFLNKNPDVSFNVVSEDIFVPSDFSSDDGLACSATSFFKSIIIDGRAQVVTDTKQIINIFSFMMQNFQPQDGYKPFNSLEYEKKFKGMLMIKINIDNLSAKFKFGQNLNQERFTKIINNLEKRGTKLDLLTAKTMKELRQYNA